MGDGLKRAMAAARATRKPKRIETPLIKRILDTLFASGRIDRTPATRLVLVNDDKGLTDMGGWCREAIRDVMIDEMAKELPAQRKAKKS